MKIIILGSTGSIGQNAVKVVTHLNNLNKKGVIKEKVEVAGLVANSNWPLLLKQIKTVKPKSVALIDKNASDALASRLKHYPVNICQTRDDIHRMIGEPSVNMVLVAISGAEALPFTMTAINAGKNLALANKEVLVMAGEIIIPLASKKGITILPVDSEHSAVFQALHCGNHSDIKQVILTASGGPFYNHKKQALNKITLEEALKHPTWKMGEKITIDSATLVNKALEIIEAHWLFNLSVGQIKVVIHPQSIVHSMVEFRDGSIIAQMGKPDMKTPIQFALTYPERLPASNGTIINNCLPDLTFSKPDKDRFPALKLGYQVVEEGGTSGAVLNAANEEAVKMFRARKIHFTDIIPLAQKTLNKHKIIANPTIRDIWEADEWARKEIRRHKK
ncbi:MAG: 1-deoxy-D-xylulose-5-phosphate reductoisomerase [Planctomycetes bacterium]|nr:1-deoxy-D-xylulose-5-phosphate reductoisomerase [Planctomycetota bacterium]